MSINSDGARPGRDETVANRIFPAGEISTLRADVDTYTDRVARCLNTPHNPFPNRRLGENSPQNEKFLSLYTEFLRRTGKKKLFYQYTIHKRILLLIFFFKLYFIITNTRTRVLRLFRHPRLNYLLPPPFLVFSFVLFAYLEMRIVFVKQQTFFPKNLPALSAVLGITTLSVFSLALSVSLDSVFLHRSTVRSWPDFRPFLRGFVRE